MEKLIEIIKRICVGLGVGVIFLIALPIVAIIFIIAIPITIILSIYSVGDDVLNEFERKRKVRGNKNG